METKHSCLRYFGAAVSWAEASNSCASPALGAHLLTSAQVQTVQLPRAEQGTRVSPLTCNCMQWALEPLWTCRSLWELPKGHWSHLGMARSVILGLCHLSTSSLCLASWPSCVSECTVHHQWLGPAVCSVPADTQRHQYNRAPGGIPQRVFSRK